MKDNSANSAWALRIAGGALVVAVAAATFIGTIPLSAQAKPGNPSTYGLFIEQVASQKTIGALNATADNGAKVQYIALGKVTKDGSSKRNIAIRARLTGGTDIKGTLVLQKAGSKWYFFSVTAKGSDTSTSVARPDGISTSVVSSAIAQQTKHQSVITGLVSGGYKLITVTGRKGNFGTRTVNVKLSGGSRKATTGQIVSISKKDSDGKVFWFLTDFR